MKIERLLIILCTFWLNIANAELSDIAYQFDMQKVSVSGDSFHFLRSFVEYYYALISANKNQLNLSKISSFSGWCVGDAHPENFGIVLQNNLSPMFTMNDMDDFGPCPVAYDLLRLLVSSRLYLSNIDINPILDSYKQGLAGGNMTVPPAVQIMINSAGAAGSRVEPKKINGNSFIRKSSMREVTTEEKRVITDNIESLYKAEGLKIIDLVATSKSGGGSGGLLRYEVLCTVKDQLLHLELKELVAPSITPVATAVIDEQSDRMKTALTVEQGKNFSHYYDVLTIIGKEMLLRPRFAGNIGVDLSISNEQENTKIIVFEAYVLGRIHAESVQVSSYLTSLRGISLEQIESDVVALTNLFNRKYNTLQKTK
jgi:hypothetical protein